jgi:hypothetical protein
VCDEAEAEVCIPERRVKVNSALHQVRRRHLCRSGGGISGGGALANEAENGVEDSVACGRAAGSSIGSGTGTAVGSLGNEDGPLAVEISNSQGKLVLLDLKLELANGFIYDEGVCGGVKLANLALADVKGIYTRRACQLFCCLKRVLVSSFKLFFDGFTNWGEEAEK